jgi:ubiquinone/menaquinone biosynthesis C-methylase UbiE
VTSPAGHGNPSGKFLHYLFRRLERDGSTTFLNYGFAYRDGGPPDLVLAPEDVKDANAIQLYHHVTSGAVIEGASVLEVGSGRGGGAVFLTRYRRPAEYVGLDISAPTTALCNRLHRLPGLSFAQGEAEALPFPPERFDVVVNIESARCYGDLGAFFREVFRVLTPGGFFLFADMFGKGDVQRTRRLLSDTGFETTKATDIRENVILAMRRDSEHRKALIDARVPAFLRRGFYEVGGVLGSNRFRDFESGRFDYWSFELRKPGRPQECREAGPRSGEGGGIP